MTAGAQTSGGAGPSHAGDAEKTELRRKLRKRIMELTAERLAKKNSKVRGLYLFSGPERPDDGFRLFFEEKGGEVIKSQHKHGCVQSYTTPVHCHQPRGL